MEEQIGCLIQHLRDEAEKCANNSRGPIHGTEYANGVSAGLEYAADELEDMQQ